MDGTLFVVAGGVQFRVYQGLLVDRSPMFRNMVAGSPPPPRQLQRMTLRSQSQAPYLAIELQEQPEEVRALLRALMPSAQPKSVRFLSLRQCTFYAETPSQAFSRDGDRTVRYRLDVHPGGPQVRSRSPRRGRPRLPPPLLPLRPRHLLKNSQYVPSRVRHRGHLRRPPHRRARPPPHRHPRVRRARRARPRGRIYARGRVARRPLCERPRVVRGRADDADARERAADAPALALAGAVRAGVHVRMLLRWQGLARLAGLQRARVRVLLRWAEGRARHRDAEPGRVCESEDGAGARDGGDGWGDGVRGVSGRCVGTRGVFEAGGVELVAPYGWTGRPGAMAARGVLREGTVDPLELELYPIPILLQ